MSFYYLAFSLPALGQLKEAESASRMALKLSPESIGSRLWLAIVLDLQGRREEALALALLDTQDWSRHTALACLYHRLGRSEESAAEMTRLEETCGSHAAFQVAQAHAVRGEVDDAFEWLERAYDQRDAGVSLIKICPWFDAIKGDPRWGAFLRKVGLGD
jgi:Flp pilus assembly protein TadD